jgi:hypothetical protein
VAFTPRWTPEALAAYNRLKAEAQEATKAEGLFKQAHKCVDLLTNNPRHPGLHTHPYDSIPNPYDSKQKVFEAYAHNQTPGAYRVFWCYGPGKAELTIIAITPHP